MDFSLNLDTFYDCREIFNSDLDEKCQDKIINNYTRCNHGGDIDFSSETYRMEEYDERNIYCNYYFSRFTQKKQKFQDNNYICKNKNNEIYYDQLLIKSIKQKDYTNGVKYCPPYTDYCGILDTKDNVLCLETCPDYIFEFSSTSRGISVKINNNNYLVLNNPGYSEQKISISAIFSENRPLNHDWDKMIKETFEDISKKNSNKRRTAISPDFNLIDELNDNTYSFITPANNNIKISDIISKIKGLNEEETRKKYNIEQTLNLYTRNYIGFEDIDELNKFRKIFNDKDDTDNPLYKLSSSGHDPLITIIIACLFLCAAIAYLILLFYKKIKEELFNISIFAFIIILGLFLISDLIIIIYHFVEYPTISIDMDSRMKKVLDKYNRRTINCQLYRIISLVFKITSEVLIGIYVYKKRNKNLHTN